MELFDIFILDGYGSISLLSKVLKIICLEEFKGELTNRKLFSCIIL